MRDLIITPSSNDSPGIVLQDGVVPGNLDNLKFVLEIENTPSLMMALTLQRVGMAAPRKSSKRKAYGLSKALPK